MLQYDETNRWSFEQLSLVYEKLTIPNIPIGLPTVPSAGVTQLVNPAELKLPHSMYVPSVSMVKVPIPSNEDLTSPPSVDSFGVLWKYELNST
jgi:hypothetical protein